MTIERVTPSGFINETATIDRVSPVDFTNETVSVLATIAVPFSDIAANGWLPSTGSDLFAMLDESVQDNADYIYSPGFYAPTGSFEVKLSTIADPLSSSDHVISIGLQATVETCNYQFYLVEGSTVLDSWTETVTVGAGAVTRTRTLSGTVADSITDYSNLRIRGYAY